MPLTLEQVKSRKEELIQELLDFEKFLESKMDLDAFYSREEFDILVDEFVKQKYTSGREVSKVPAKQVSQIYVKIGRFQTYLELIGSLATKETSDGRYYYRKISLPAFREDGLKRIREI